MRTSLLLALFLLLAASAPALATTPPNIAQIPTPTNWNVCQSTALRLCGIQFLASPGIVGTTQSFDLPARFVAREITFQCVSLGGAPYYAILGDPSALCALKTCPPGSVNVCGSTLPVDRELRIGDATQLAIPRDYYASAVAQPTNVFVECALENGASLYKLKDAYKIPCTEFTCRPAKIDACDSTVTIPNASDLGAVLHLQTHNRRPVVVQCMEPDGQTLQYRVTDCNPP